MPKAEKKTEDVTVPKESYRVFDNRANLIAQVNSEEEAKALAADRDGFYNKVT